MLSNSKIFPLTTVIFLVSSFAFMCEPVLAGRQRVEGQKITPSEARSYFQQFEGQLQARTASLPDPNQIAEEMHDLVIALEEDYELIYKFVHDNIEYTPYFGSAKGPYMTLMDRSGNSFDQAALLVTMLRAAGYDASYVYGTIRMEAEDVTAWLGVPVEDGDIVAKLLPSAGIPCEIYVDEDDKLAYIEVDHVWVKMDDYDCASPALKSHIHSPGINLQSAMGYSASNFLNRATAGATINPNYVRNINKTNIAADLTTYSSSLANYIKNNKHGASLNDIIGGGSIDTDTSSYFYIWNCGWQGDHLNCEMEVHNEWTEIPAEYKTTLRIQHRGIDETLYSADIYGKRLTIFYNGSDQPVLSLDGQTLATGISTTPGTSQDITLSIDHPYPSHEGTYCDGTEVCSITAGGSYSIVNGWADTGRKIIEKHREILQQNRQAGLSEDSEEVLGESLTMISLTYLAEDTYSSHILGNVADVFVINHHTVGVCGQYSGPYIDLPLCAGSYISDSNDSSKEQAVFFSGHGSAFEWGVVEQLQPYGAVSAIKLIDISNAKSDKIFNATGANYYATVKPQLINYSASELVAIEEDIGNGHRLILPQDGDLSEGDWKGVGYISVSPDETSIAHIISGGYNGGYSTEEDAEVDSEEVETKSEYVQPNEKKTTSAEPIDMLTGNYLYDHQDVSSGSGAYPFSLGFNRSYSSGSRLQDGPLGLGWKHNLQASVSTDSDGFQGMGEDSPIDAAGAIAGAYAAIDLISSGSTITNFVVATVADKWFMDKLLDNVVSISLADNTMQFVKLPNGSYNPPPGKADTLSVEGDSSFLLRSKHGEYFDFDPNRNLVSWRDPNNTVNYSYDANGKLLQVSNEFTRSFTLTYDVSDPNHISTITDSAGRSVNFGYNSKGELITVTDANSCVTTFEYDPNNDGQLKAIYYPANPANPYVFNYYNSSGQVTRQLDARGNEYKYYCAAGFRTVETDPCNWSKIYSFNHAGNLILEENQEFEQTIYEYDGQQRLVRQIYPWENAIQYVYDNRHNVTEVIKISMYPADPNIVEHFTYESNFNRVSSSTDALGNVTSFYYWPNGKLKRIDQPEVDGDTPQTHYTYNSYGQLKTITDAMGTVTKYEYDPATAGLTETIFDYGTGPDNLNITTSMTYNAIGDVNSTTDARGNTTRFEYDPMRRLKKTIAPAPFDYITQYEYNPDGDAVKIRRQTDDANQPWQTTSYTYTLSGKIETITDPNGNVTTHQYDGRDKLWKVTDAQNNTTTRLYDRIGRLEQVIDAEDNNSVTYTYWQNDQIWDLFDAKGNQSYYDYDGYSRLYSINYGYHYPFDFEYFELDPAGNIIEKWTSDWSKDIYYSYDSLNRMASKELEDCEKWQSIYYEYSYDLIGRLIEVTMVKEVDWEEIDTETIQNTYDNIGRLINVAYPRGKTVSYEYDASGNRTKLAYPDGTYITYDYDQLNRLTDIRDVNGTVLMHYDYDALSRRTGSQYANGTTAGYNYDISSRLTNLNNQIGVQSRDFAYSYDNVGNRLSMTVDSNDVHSYEYDKLYQLTGVDYPAGYFADDTVFNYDAAGSRQSVVNGGTTDYTTNKYNQYTSVGDVNCYYNGNGNLTDDGTNTYYYDPEDRLTDVNTPAGIIEYGYDAFNRRIEKQMRQNLQLVTQYYIYDGDSIIAEYDGFGKLRKKFIYGTGIDEVIMFADFPRPPVDITGDNVVDLEELAVIAQSWLLDSESPDFDPNSDLDGSGAIDFVDFAILANYWRDEGEPGGWYFYHYDGLGSVVALSDTSGNMVEKYEYDVFGQVTILSPSDEPQAASNFGNCRMFTGREYDPETGNYYYRARYYNPQIGRFLSRDPLGYADSMNLYQYCGNNPVMFVDPMGLCKDSSDSFWSDLWAGKYFGTGYGASSTDIWAARAVASDTWYGKAGNYFMGGLSALWTPETWKETTITLGTAWFGGPKGVNTGKTAVYSSVDDGVTNYVGMTDDIARRAAEQFRLKGINIKQIRGLSNLSRADARAVEQVLIEHHGLGKSGGTLLNRINTIAKTNPVYGESIKQGIKILKTVNYPGF